jgi:hypothetical protein
VCRLLCKCRALGSFETIAEAHTTQTEQCIYCAWRTVCFSGARAPWRLAFQGEAEVKLMSLVRSRLPNEHHTFLSDDSDVSVMALCMPLNYEMNIVSTAQRVCLHTRALSGWVLQNWKHAEKIKGNALQLKGKEVRFQLKRASGPLQSEDGDGRLASICQVRVHLSQTFGSARLSWMDSVFAECSLSIALMAACAVTLLAFFELAKQWHRRCGSKLM